MRRKLRDQRSFSDPWLSAEPAQELAAMSTLLGSDPTPAVRVEQDLEAARHQHGTKWSAGGLSRPSFHAYAWSSILSFNFLVLARKLRCSGTSLHLHHRQILPGRRGPVAKPWAEPAPTPPEGAKTEPKPPTAFSLHLKRLCPGAASAGNRSLLDRN